MTIEGDGPVSNPNDLNDETMRGLQMLEDRVGLVIPADDPMASAAAQNELSLARLAARLDAEDASPGKPADRVRSPAR
ncbi:MAG: hypothetical protein L6Q75_00790 [Burkholderiaceae bacterium]|nr:hypothetical protein [Burkholderiaceae bacterium]